MLKIADAERAVLVLVAYMLLIRCCWGHERIEADVLHVSNHQPPVNRRRCWLLTLTTDEGGEFGGDELAEASLFRAHVNPVTQVTSIIPLPLDR